MSIASAEEMVKVVSKFKELKKAWEGSDFIYKKSELANEEDSIQDMKIQI